MMPRLDENLIVIPNWHKTIAEWWVLETYVRYRICW